MKVWTCKIGEVDEDTLPHEQVEAVYSPDQVFVSEKRRSADQVMRDAVEAAYKEFTGQEPTYTFSGWGGELTPGERAVVDNVLPMVEEVTYYVARCTNCHDTPDLDGGEYQASLNQAIGVAVNEAEWVHVGEHELLCTECRRPREVGA